MQYENVIKTTKEFDYKYCIGVRGYKVVCIVALPRGQVVVVKKLHQMQNSEEIADLKEIECKIYVLTNICYQNIVKLYVGIFHMPDNHFLYMNS